LFKGIGLVPNWQKKNVSQMIAEIQDFFTAHTVPVYVVPTKDPLLHMSSPIKELEEWSHKVDLVIAVGGDGTFLRVAREVAFMGLPILGLNLGYKGFLAGIEVGTLGTCLQKLICGDYSIEERLMLQTTVLRNDKSVFISQSLNDVIISRGPFSRIIKLDTYINNDFLESYPGDGLIIATPTGSTGYSLSAGGPVVNPSLQLLLITPICPHLLYQRSVIVNREDLVSVIVATSSADIFLTLDGQEGFALKHNDCIRVKRSASVTRVITFAENNFYKTLHNKLLEA
jgi:NAD+ kinase